MVHHYPSWSYVFLSISFVNKYWNSVFWSVCNEKAFGLTVLIFGGSVPVLVFVYLSEYSNYSVPFNL